MAFEVGAVEVALVSGLVVALVLAYFLFFKPPPPIEVEDDDDAQAGADGDDSGVPMSIMYGSQTGTAEEFAGELAKEARRNGYSPRVHDLEDYNLDDLPNEKLAVFLMSTFGEGDPTDSAVEFNDWMGEDQGRSALDGVEFAVFALGNTQYEKFCEMGKKTDKKLAAFGATRIAPLGMGDDDKSIEDDFAQWRQTFFKAANERYGTQASGGEAKFTPTWSFEFLDGVSSSDARAYKHGQFQAPPGSKDVVDACRVAANRELRQDTKEGSTRHIEFEIENSAFGCYKTADNLGVCPRNDHTAAARLAKRLGAPHLKKVFRYKVPDGSKQPPIPQVCSVLDCLVWYLDINSPPKKALLTTFAQFCEDPDQAAELRTMGSPEGKALYEAKIHSKKVYTSLAQLFERYSSLNVPFSSFVELCPYLQPRYYTISSSSNAQPDRISITASVLQGGVATNYLAGLSVKKGHKAPVFVRPSSFRLPRNPSLPIIMVGPGTGIAPFMGFIQEFKFRLEQKSSAKPGPRVLYFGCRRNDGDFIYRETLREAKEQGVLTELRTAFSRQTDQKVYVQHLMREDGKSLWELLQRGAYIYVCGATAMGRDVKDTFVHVVTKFGKKSKSQAAEYVAALQKNERYVQELWST